MTTLVDCSVLIHSLLGYTEALRVKHGTYRIACLTATFALPNILSSVFADDGMFCMVAVTSCNRIETAVCLRLVHLIPLDLASGRMHGKGHSGQC